MRQNQISSDLSRCMTASLTCFSAWPTSSMSLNVLGTSGCASVCWHVAGGAEVAPRRDVGEHLAVAVHEVGDADHRRTGAFGVLPAVTVEAAIGLQRELIVVDGMRNDRRLLRIVAHHAACRR